jgi:hypothetical protein
VAVKSYPTPAAFKMALNTVLRTRATATGRPIDRVRSVLTMERLLARVLQVAPGMVLLKGGLALELRFERARATRDIDLRVSASPADLDEILGRIASATTNPDDYLRFEMVSHPRHPTIHGDGVIYEGRRYVVTPRLAAQPYGSAFGLDISFGDAVCGSPAVVRGNDTLAFVGVEAVEAQCYPLTSHIAEKLHAYTLRGADNTRTKDLVDIGLIAMQSELAAGDLRAAIDATFAFRATHHCPARCPDPPAAWDAPYARMAQAENLRWRDLAELTAAVQTFLDPALSGVRGDWNPSSWAWIDCPAGDDGGKHDKTNHRGHPVFQ